MPYEDQLGYVRRPVGCVARGREHEPEPELEHELGRGLGLEPGREPGREREHGRVLSAAIGSCSLVVAAAVQLEVMMIPYEVVDHMGLPSRVEVVGVHRHADGVEAGGVARGVGGQA